MEHGPSVAQMFGNPDVIEEVTDVGSKAFEIRLHHEAGKDIRTMTPFSMCNGNG